MIQAVSDNIFRIDVPLPGNPLKWLNSYLIRAADGGRHLLIDTGFNRPECRDALFSALREELARLKKRESELEMERPDNWII